MAEQKLQKLEALRLVLASKQTLFPRGFGVLVNYSNRITCVERLYQFVYFVFVTFCLDDVLCCYVFSVEFRRGAFKHFCAIALYRGCAHLS